MVSGPTKPARRRDRGARPARRLRLPHRRAGGRGRLAGARHRA
nr:hypothetical protein [Angustibacter aerolatus]